ncbi:hypothetical protein HBN50_14180 [Halobacteriovorax sp. GB3]|uniref:hypothetical protein n=1 Tax=Halobacteriovorax sp. GB3 TaxID=2719615 RepID=UPI00235FF2F1|nr:hypothetical protein [Halobacteriovorax sp. GB3]MDD0854257.1 hypothetical protein [Halobacteriovorax sp. GB3]
MGIKKIIFFLSMISLSANAIEGITYKMTTINRIGQKENFLINRSQKGVLFNQSNLGLTGLYRFSFLFSKLENFKEKNIKKCHEGDFFLSIANKKSVENYRSCLEDSKVREILSEFYKKKP